ncbi:bifunctional riboflavin kinase/FAD synthetase [Thalassorhabdus alkalitolerans]|uniref:Riboflavin biosynthesis protein n=1 Tax=Thalassorhabdus alkalitolerans TaxID=2282697 RepID=A0ABW0YIF6_9BACI
METIYLYHPHSYTKNDLPETVIALGYFDGVHRGHQKVIKAAKAEAEKRRADCAVMTFHPHPKSVLSSKVNEEDMKYITPMPDKESEMKRLGVDRLYIVNFDLTFAALTPQEFVDQYLIGLHAVHIVAGFDYSYGRMGKGTMETLPFHSRGQFGQSTVGKLEEKDEKISSTLIRTKLSDGEIEEANTLLGRRYKVTGKVVHGEKRGRTIGFPTANVSFSFPYVYPALGVYAVSLKVGQNVYDGVCNVGYKPTFHKERKGEPNIEVHLFSFEKDIYDEDVEVIWHKRIRQEKKFSSVDDLVKQIEKDKQEAEHFFKEEKSRAPSK